MVRDITLGQFMPGNSFIHRIDARAKILLLTAYIVFIFLCSNFASLLLMALFTLLIIFMTKISFIRYLASMKVILFVIVLTGFINLFYGTGKTIFEWWIFRITDGGIYNAIYVIVRIAVLMMISAVLTYTTSPSDLTDALERLMKPLKLIRVPVHEIAMMMTIALRFIPVLLEETDKIMNAQKARGADMESGNLINKVKSLVPVLIPLFVSSFRRAGDLAMAMECRCYNGDNNRTRMKVLHFSYVDIISALVCVLVFAGVICSNMFIETRLLMGIK